jgi:predicted O-linked N-acetylglucosamine transferase (SPINDLY family)
LSAARSALAGGDAASAERTLRQMLHANREDVDALYYLSRCLAAQGRYDDSVHSFSELLARRPNYPGAALQLDFARGLAELGRQEYPAAAASLRRAIARDARIADLHCHLGATLVKLGDAAGAMQAYQRAVALRPDDAAALLELGLLAADGDDPETAVKYLSAAWQQNPSAAAVVLAVCAALDRLGVRGLALEIYERSAGPLAANVEVHEAHGMLLHRLGRQRDALTCYARGLQLDPNRRGLRLNRAHALESLGSIAAARDSFRAMLAADPDDRSALAGAASCAMRICDWDLAEEASRHLSRSPAGIDALHPFLRLALDIEPARVADSYRREAARIAARTSQNALSRHRHEHVRVAYISPDFRGHPVAYAIAGVIKGHDRRIIEPVCVSLTAPDTSDIGRELRGACDFLDGSAMTDRDLVRLLRAREIDIAVDLAGFTAGARPAVFAARVAPVQLNYLGFPSSTGAGYMDAMIADDIVMPVADEHLAAERVLRLPHAYLPFDRSRAIAMTPPDRRACGLPDAGFVFCGFTNGYKLSRAVFDTWLTLLAEVPESVLWLRQGPAAMQENLVRAACQRGIDAERLVFAPFVGRMDRHFARLALADLMLDTAPYNAHTTTAEALWAGVPVVTWRGRAFAGRVGASLLSAAGLSELVADSLEDYRLLALRLARSPEALAAVRARLALARTAAPLFDTRQYVHDFETVLCALAKPA